MVLARIVPYSTSHVCLSLFLLGLSAYRTALGAAAGYVVVVIVSFRFASPRKLGPPAGEKV